MEILKKIAQKAKDNAGKSGVTVAFLDLQEIAQKEKVWYNEKRLKMSIRKQGW